MSSMKKINRSRVGFTFGLLYGLMFIIFMYVVVTVDGTVLHKTGMITGGQGDSSSHSQRWEEKDLDGTLNTWY